MQIACVINSKIIINEVQFCLGEFFLVMFNVTMVQQTIYDVLNYCCSRNVTTATVKKENKDCMFAYSFVFTFNIHIKCEYVIVRLTGVHSRMTVLCWLNDDPPHVAIWLDIQTLLYMKLLSVFEPLNGGCGVGHFTVQHNGISHLSALLGVHLWQW